MKSIFDYLKWRGDLPFGQDGINEVDGLIFSILAYIDWAKIDYKDRTLDQVGVLADSFSRAAGDLGPRVMANRIRNLTETLALTVRYGNVRILDYEKNYNDEVQMQFSATTFVLPSGVRVIAFRGTDESLVGWKEDLNMSFCDGIPSQFEATRYVQEKLQPDTSYVLCGHSKGGNLAVWAATHVKAPERCELLAVFSNDAPGFRSGILETEAYRRIRSKIGSFVPESSVVGILMEHDDYITIKSKGVAVFQHDPFTWKISGKKFRYTKKRTLYGATMDRVLNDWINSLTTEERENFVECIWTVVSSSQAKTILDFSSLKKFFSMQKTFLLMDMGTKKKVMSILFRLLTESAKIRKSIPENKYSEY
ncbi:MAG: DUF2974 domain-containing protein [Lachnospiraceae bacterium]|nr:DUF2974 domain-containing protein [Lachnospiraceae bacterium]